MKKLLIIAVAATATTIVACSDVKRTPGSIYMPDMAYSRAYETYGDHSNLYEQGIHYTAMPVEGTVPRGAELPFHITKDAAGDTTNYYASRQVPNPVDSMSEADTEEADRLYQINCGICHGSKLDGKGPLWKEGDGPYKAAPKNLIGDATVLNMPDGQMFYSVTYGKNMMGSYASQLSRKQRWMVIKYIKNKQKEAKAAAATSVPATK